MKYTKIIKIVIVITSLASSLQSGTGAKQFCFQDTVVEEKKTVESNLITIEGLDKDEKLQLRGIGAYMLNGVYMGRKSTQVKNGDQVRLIHESIDVDGAKVSTVLMVGNTYDVFTSVTNKGGLPQNNYMIDSYYH